MQRGKTKRLAHGWRLSGSDALDAAMIAEYLPPAVEAVPPEIAARLGPCNIKVRPVLEGANVVSKWSRTALGFDIELAAEDQDLHGLALELLRCLGQALWEKLEDIERAAWLKLLEAEMEAGISGEIDEDALEAKRALLGSREAARNAKKLLEYAAVSFAGTAAEYVHALWHDVTVRTGPEHLGAAWLRCRLEFLERRFPPARGRHLFG